MTLPGHGSAFMRLPCWRHGNRGGVNRARVLVGVYGVCMCAYSAGRGVVAKGQEVFGSQTLRVDQ